MGMRYVDRGPLAQQKGVYFTPEENDECVEILKNWRGPRREALDKGDPKLCPIPEYVAIRVHKICENISHRYNYHRKPYREEMVSDALVNILRYLHTFNPERIGERSQRVNFFSWVTQCVDRSFGSRIKKEEEQDYYKNALFCQQDGFAAFSEDEDAMEGTNLTLAMSFDFITRAKDYETKQEARKAKKREQTKLQQELLLQSKEPEDHTVTPEPKKSLFRFAKQKD